MTSNEYTQLIEFLGRKFEEIDRRFDRIDAKLADHDERFERIDERFREVFGHFDHLYTKVPQLSARVLISVLCGSVVLTSVLRPLSLL